VSHATKSTDNVRVHIRNENDWEICFFMRKLSISNDTFFKINKDLPGGLSE